MSGESITIVKSAIGFLVGILTSMFGSLDELFTLLLIMIFIDFISGLMKGLVNKDIDSDKFFKGGVRKISIFLVVIVATQIEIYLGDGVPLRGITISYYIINEGISFIENISNFVDLPEEFIKYFKKSDGGDVNE